MGSTSWLKLLIASSDQASKTGLTEIEIRAIDEQGIRAYTAKSHTIAQCRKSIASIHLPSTAGGIARPADTSSYILIALNLHIIWLLANHRTAASKEQLYLDAVLGPVPNANSINFSSEVGSSEASLYPPLQISTVGSGMCKGIGRY